jgi:hypothetical protein
MQNVTPVATAALALELAPAVLFALVAQRMARAVSRWPVALRLSLPAVLVAPYLLVGISYHLFEWTWFALYAILPVAIAARNPSGKILLCITSSSLHNGAPANMDPTA